MTSYSFRKIEFINRVESILTALEKNLENIDLNNVNVKDEMEEVAQEVKTAILRVKNNLP